MAVRHRTVASDYQPGGGCNAIKVTEHGTVSMSFLKVIGIESWGVRRGDGGSCRWNPHPLDIQMVVDTSGSMLKTCDAAVSGVPRAKTTKVDCANAGIRALLSTLLPCALTSPACLSAGDALNVLNPIDRVGLMVFPAFFVPNATNHLTPNSTNGAIQEETDCIDNVNDNNVDQNYSSNKTKSNQVVPLSSDYRLSDTATTLNPQSSLVQGVWWKNCPGGVYPTGDGSANTSIVGGGTQVT